MPSSALIEKRNTLDARRDELAKALEEAKNSAAGADRAYDDDKLAKAFGVKVADLGDEIARRRKEINALQTDVEGLVSEDEAEDLRKAEGERGWQNGIPVPNGKQKDRKSAGLRVHELGSAFVKSAAYTERGRGVEAKFAIDVKTLFETSAGWAPESTRLAGYEPAAFRPVQILDFIPRFRTSQETIKFMEETTRTNNAAEKAEGAAYAESAFAFTERSQTVEKITDSVPVTDEQLEDVEAAEDYLNQALPENIRQRLDTQVLQGDGNTPNLLGILNKGSIQTQAKGSDPVFDAIHKAITKVRVTGRAVPSVVFLHSNDWQDIVLTRTAEGIYIMGNPASMPDPRLWGLPVVPNEVNTENTGLVVASSKTALYVKKEITLSVGFVNDDFTKGKKTVRAEMRAAMVTRRAAAYCTVTGI